MLFIITLIIVGVVFIILNEIVTALVYGSLISKDTAEKVVKNYISMGHWHSSNILSGYPNLISFISVAQSLVSKWFIHGVGRIPRWSNAHKLLEEAHLKYITGEYEKKK
jgi:hypothetical protein